MNSQAEISQLTYRDIIHEHQRLDLDFDQTVAVIQQLFPEHLEAAIALWNYLEAQRFGVLPHA